MKLQRRDLFRATVAGLLHKVLPSAAVTPATDVVVAAATTIKVWIGPVGQRVWTSFRDPLP